MKKFMFLAIVAMFATMNVFAADNQKTTTTQEDNSFITCQFSLNRYSGTIFYNRGVSESTTDNIVVGVSCPQDEDVRATVFVYIDGSLVASEVVTIYAGKDKSNGGYIVVDKEYEGKRYTLEVQ